MFIQQGWRDMRRPWTRGQVPLEAHQEGGPGARARWKAEDEILLLGVQTGTQGERDTETAEVTVWRGEEPGGGG